MCLHSASSSATFAPLRWLHLYTHVVSLTGPGLAIRIICGDEPYQGNDFAETNIILGQIVDFATAKKKVSSVKQRSRVFTCGNKLDIEGGILRFPMTSRPPCWCHKTKKR